MPSSPLFSRFAEAAQRTPQKVAVIADDERRTYAELEDEIKRVAGHLLELGVRPGEHIGVILPNCIEFVHVLLAAARIGAVIVPQSTGASKDAVRRAFPAARVQHLICWHGAVGELVPQDLADWPEFRAGVRIVVGGAVDAWHDFQALLGPVDEYPPPPSVGPDQPFLILLTSGSTGAPKPILLSQETKVARAQSAIDLYRLNADDVVLAATPLHHSLADRMVLIPLLIGGTSVIMRHYNAASWLDTVEAHGVSFTIAVSSQLKQIIPLLDQRPAPTSLRCLVSSSAALDPASKAALLARLDCAFHEIYGASEIASATDLATRKHPAKLDTVGEAIPGIEVGILGRDEQLLPAGKAGEIVCRTPLMFSGYHLNPEATRDAMWNGYFRTGDEGLIDEDGFLHFLGRIKDIIIVGGINVYPRDIEEVVESHPDVLECAAVPVGDERLGEVVGVVVVARPEVAMLDERALKRLCAMRLGDAQQPHHFFQIQRLPRNEMGKIDKPALRARFSNFKDIR